MVESELGNRWWRGRIDSTCHLGRVAERGRGWNVRYHRRLRSRWHASSVSFNGVAASISSDSSSAITTSVPSGAPVTGTSGPLTVTTPEGSTSASFTVLPNYALSFFDDGNAQGVRNVRAIHPALTSVVHLVGPLFPERQLPMIYCHPVNRSRSSTIPVRVASRCVRPTPRGLPIARPQTGM